MQVFFNVQMTSWSPDEISLNNNWEKKHREIVVFVNSTKTSIIGTFTNIYQHIYLLDCCIRP